MTRYTDALFFGFLFVLDVAAWLITWAVGALPEVAADQLAPLTVAVIVVIAAPAFAAIAVLALARGLLRTPPKVFWTWVTGGALIITSFMALSFFVTRQMGLELGFLTALWFMVIVAVCAVIAWFLSVIGAISLDSPVAFVKADEAASADGGTVEEPVTERLIVDTSDEAEPTIDMSVEDTN
jgi:hypothetical protein